MFYGNGSGKFQSSAIHSMPVLATNDYLELFCECDTASNILVEEVNLFIVGLPNSV